MTPQSPDRADEAGGVHTPGPWEAALAADSYEQRGVYGPNNEHVGWAVNGSAIPGRTTANARLIAAAPDLLVSLQHAVEIIEKYVPVDALGMNYEGDPQVAVHSWPLREEYLHYMREAIAKALPSSEQEK
jgi:hypothetical protein